MDGLPRSQAQRSWPLIASKARTTPDGASRSWPSRTWPVGWITTPRITTGDEAGLGVAGVLVQIHIAVVAEALAQLAGGGVERAQAAIDHRPEDALGAFGDRGGGLEIGHAAAGGGGDAGHRFGVGLGIEAPALLAGRGLHRDHLLRRGADVDQIADLQRGVLERV